MTKPKGLAIFVKSADTRTTVRSSKMELERLMQRYGAQQFSTAQDYLESRVVVLFRIPDTLRKGSEPVEVRIPVETKRVYDAMYGRPTIRKFGDGRWQDVHDAAGYNAKKLEQAERVAWRNLVLWVDAQLSAAAVGLQTVTEAFLAHAAIGPNRERVIDVIPAYLEARRALASGEVEA